MEIDEAAVDAIVASLMAKGLLRTEANSMAVNIYLLRHVNKLQQDSKDAIMRQAGEDRRPMNTAQRKRSMRPTQTSWRTAHANV